MKPAPRMVPRPLLESEVEAHRVLGCPHYDDCLSALVRQQVSGRGLAPASSWSCAGCPVGGLPAAELAQILPDEQPEASTRSRVLELLRGQLRPWQADELAEALGVERFEAAREADRLRREGRIVGLGPAIWGAIGLAPAVPPERRHTGLAGRVLQVIQSEGDSWSPAQIARQLGESGKRVATACWDLASYGVVERVGRGLYRRAG